LILAQEIRRLRLHRRWNQTELAKRVGVGQCVISAYELGQRDPTLEVLMRLSAVFGKTLDELVYGTDHGPPSRSFRSLSPADRLQVLEDLDEDDCRAVQDHLDLLASRRHARRRRVPPPPHSRSLR
jgi:transcriptional regulator with XRE-family HTH domain